MNRTVVISLVCSTLLISCNNDSAKVEELEKKLEKQSTEMQTMKETMLENELEKKEKEIEELKAKEREKKNPNPTNSDVSNKFYAQGFGRYPVASNRILTYDDVAYMNKKDLTIMRNEIFARHGYIFKTQEMIEYFSKQNWYRPLYDDVYKDLSDIENKNIQYIKSFE